MEQNVNELTEELKVSGNMLTRLFTNKVNAEKAFNFLIEKGYNKKDITIIMSDETRAKFYPLDTVGTEITPDAIVSAEKGTAIGGSIGMTMGAIVGIALALGSNIVIPGFGFLIAGPLLAGLAGAGTGAIAGSLIGSLMGIGFEEDKAKLYEASLKNGQILLGVYPQPEDMEVITLAWKTIEIVK